MISLRYYTGDGVELSPVEQSLYGKDDVVRQATRAAIRRFVNRYRELLTGRVLDYGCGKIGTCAIPQPYRSLLAQGTDYHGWEPGDAPPKAGEWDSILCTQVVQNIENPDYVIEEFCHYLKPRGYLVMTYPTAWEEIETERWRFTKAGAWLLCHEAGLIVLSDEPLVEVKLDGSLNLTLVRGLVAQR